MPLSDEIKRINRLKAANKVVWKPQPRQLEFLKRPEYEAFYGGAAGGGKSDALLAEALRQVEIPHYKGLILRRTYPELNELMDRSIDIYKAAFPKARFNESKHFWRFPSGAKIYFGAMQHSKDKTKYQGQAYDYIGFDELTHFTFDEYTYLYSRNRPKGPGTRVYIRATGNPGGIGHGWVRSRFIDPAPPMAPMEYNAEVQAPDGKKLKITRRRIFVPARVFDNEELLKNDPNYLANLAMLPEAEQQALLYGSWDSFSGQVFREWRDDPAHYDDRLWTHVINPFEIPRHWRIYRGFDYGYARPFSVGWYAVDTEGIIYRIAEYYGYGGAPNKGCEMHPLEIAKNIRRIEDEDPNLRGRKIIGVADPAIFASDTGEPISDMMARYPYHIMFSPGDNTRLAGKMQYHYRLAFGEDGRPMFYAFNTCKHFIRTIPALVYDEKRVEDINTNQEDHAYDDGRYVLMLNPISPRENVIERPPEDDPLNLYRDRWKFEHRDIYGFLRL